MRAYFARLTTNFKFNCIVWILLSVSVFDGSAQENLSWDKIAIRDSVKALLLKYQSLHNELNDKTDPLVVRDFLHLFPNPKVQVINELVKKPGKGNISIDQFLVQMLDLFPDGLTVKLELTRMAIGQPRYDRNNRYLIRVHVNRTLSGISAGKVFANSGRLIFTIAFKSSDSIPEGFVIFGMDLPEKGQSYFSANFAPGTTAFVNKQLNADARLNVMNRPGYQVGASYTNFLSDHWGIGAGVQLSHYANRIALDKFDALGGFDPNIGNAQIDNDLWFAEVPVYISWRTNVTKKLEFRADAGLSLGIRLFETMRSSATNSITGAYMLNVFTDEGWISQMNRTNFGLHAAVLINYRLNKGLSIFLGSSLRQGLTGLNTDAKPDYFTTKYLGQYNPMWGVPGKTVNQALFLNVGASMLLNKMEK